MLADPCKCLRLILGEEERGGVSSKTLQISQLSSLSSHLLIHNSPNTLRMLAKVTACVDINCSPTSA